MATSFARPADFVLAIQVQKMYHKKKLYIGERAHRGERSFKGAVLVDDDALEPESWDGEDDLVTASMDEAGAGRVEGVVAWVY